MSGRDTIYALSSGSPPAAIAVIRISGSQAHVAAERIAGPLPRARLAALRALRDPSSGELLDHALVLCFEAPGSSTGEDSVEFHCHGGRAVVDAVLRALEASDGLREAEPGEFTRRAFENGRIDLTEAEGLADLIEAETEAQRKAALILAEGGLRTQIAVWTERLVTLSAKAERSIDYDEDDEAVDPALIANCADLAEELGRWLERPRAEPLKDGVRVVVAGPPNVGKSSLINAIVGEDRIIVTDIPGTTRDYIEVPLALVGLPILLTDTAGLRQTEDAIEAIGIERAAKLSASADVLLWLGEPDPTPEHTHLIVVHSKSDLPARSAAPQGAIAVSSVTGSGLDELLGEIQQAARSLLPGEGAIALNRRQARHILEARVEVEAAASSTVPLFVAEHLRLAREAFDRLTGRAGVEDMLDALFGRFCLGK
jgi:tRNA modification GTPase